MHVWRPVTLRSLLFLFLSQFRICFSQLYERITILENSPINTAVLDIRAALVRHGEGQLSENATAYASQQELFWPFALDNFVIRLVRPLDREAVCQLQEQKSHRLDVSYSNTPSHSSSISNDGCPNAACCQLLHVNILPTPTALPKALFVEIVVQDVNDNAPRFPAVHSPYTMISEDSSLEERIWLPQAIDPDSSQFSVTEYRTENWVHGNQSHFQLGVEEEGNAKLSTNYQYSQLYGRPQVKRIASSTLGRPYLIPTAPLDRELCDLYAFTLVAVDGGERNALDPNTPNQALTGTVYVVIKLEDVNDNRPTFDRFEYEAKIVENSMPVNVFTFHVVDNDIGDNGRVSVSIQDTNRIAEQLFRVNLQPVQNPNIQRPNSHLLNQQTTPPSASHYRGYVQIVNRIDAERFPSVLQFSLVAVDFGKPTLSTRADVKIQIINVNDNAPHIAFFSRGKRLNDGRISIPEVVTPPGSLVVLVHVTDEDSPVTQFRCQLISETDMFSLDEAIASGLTSYRNDAVFESTLEARGIVASYRQYAIRTRKELDRETRNYFVVTVECSDAEGVNSLARNSSLHITVTDENDHNPVFDKLIYHGRVQENLPSAEVHFSSLMKVTDADIGPNSLLTFFISDLENNTKQTEDSEKPMNFINGSEYFRIDPRSGRIWTTVALDCETKNKYELLVIAHDAGLPKPRSSSATLVVAVEDVNDNVPEFTSAHFRFEVVENSPPGTEIGRIEATDKDATELNRKLRYSLRGRVEDLHLISINRNTGVLRTRRPIDRESRSSISLMATAENELPVRTTLSQHPNQMMGHPDSSEEHLAKASIVVNVINVNDNRPEFALIEPHRSHVTFIWEQLSALPNTSRIDSKATPIAQQKGVTTVKGNVPTTDETQSDKVHSSSRNINPVCERLPYRISDKDLDQDDNFNCCIVELQEDFDGLFALMPEAPNVLCVTRRPPKPTSYKLVLIAKDGTGNDSLSSQVQFTVIIRSDPSLRGTADNGQPGSLLQFTDEVNYGLRATKNSHDSIGAPTWPHTSHSKDFGLGGRSTNLQQRKLVPNSSSAHSNGQGQQTIIIVVMASVAGILCVLLLLAIMLTKRCVFDSRAEFIKGEPEPQNDGSVGMKSSSSVHSTPSKSQSCTLVSVPTQRLTPHQDYYSKEMVYHYPVRNCDQAYEMATRAGFLSPTIDRRQSNLNASTIGSISPNLLPVSFQTHGRISEPSPNLPSLLDTNVYKSESANNKLPSSPERYLSKPIAYTAWPPLSTSHAGSHPVLLTRVNPCAPKNASKRMINKPCDTVGNNQHSIYQTIDSRLIPTLRRSVADNNAALFRSATSVMRKQNNESEKPFHESQNKSSDSEPTAQRRDCCELGDPCAELDALSDKKSPLKKLQRTNSERSNYFQTSFV